MRFFLAYAGILLLLQACHPERNWSRSRANGSAEDGSLFHEHLHSRKKAFLPPSTAERESLLIHYYSRLISAATYPAPNPLSILTTLTFEAQEFIIPSNAASPLNAAP